MRKKRKNEEKSKKYAKKFAYIKNLLYLCIEIKKQDGAATRNSGKKVMKKQSNYYWIYNSCGRRTELNPVIASNLKEAAQKAKELTKNIPGHFGVSRDYSGGVNGSAAGIKITWY